MLRAATGPCRTACWAVGGQVPPRGSGAAAQSPRAQTESIPFTRRYSSTGTRPRSSSGTLSWRKLGWAVTPAVQTTVRVGTVSPVESRTLSAVTSSSWVPSRTSIPRPRSSRTA